MGPGRTCHQDADFEQSPFAAIVMDGGIAADFGAL
jgi:hypothetical protein